MRTNLRFCAIAAVIGIAGSQAALAGEQIKTANGAVEGGKTASGIRIFRGIPFAAPPVGDLRWKAPRPAQNLSLIHI